MAVGVDAAIGADVLNPGRELVIGVGAETVDDLVIGFAGSQSAFTNNI